MIPPPIPPYGTFPKIHPFWCAHPSLSEDVGIVLTPWFGIWGQQGKNQVVRMGISQWEELLANVKRAKRGFQICQGGYDHGLENGHDFDHDLEHKSTLFTESWVLSPTPSNAPKLRCQRIFAHTVCLLLSNPAVKTIQKLYQNKSFGCQTYFFYHYIGCKVLKLFLFQTNN